MYDQPKQMVQCPKCNERELVRFPGKTATIQIWSGWVKPLFLTLIALLIFSSVVGIIVYEQVKRIDVDQLTDQAINRIRIELQAELERLPAFLEENETIPKIINQVETRLTQRVKTLLADDRFIQDIVQHLKAEIMREVDSMMGEQGGH